MRKFILHDVAIAYRKVKAELFRSGIPYRSDLVDFESNIRLKFDQILAVANSCDFETASEWCHGWMLIPKKITDTGNAVHDGNVVFSNPGRQFTKNKSSGNLHGQLRLVAKTPVEFHVIMMLWLLSIGDRLEKGLSANSYGNRMRRTAEGEISKRSIGLFKHYLPQYRMWRDRALVAMREANVHGKDVVAVTADFTSFYHSLSPDFLLDQKLYENLRCKALDSGEERFTKLIVGMLNAWSVHTPLERGLPVGCSISAVIANLALAKFDEDIEKQVVPLYYGRYVDDVIVVFENTNKFDTEEDVWRWIKSRVPGISTDDSDDKIFYSDGVSISDNQKLFFEREKTKLFVIDADTGRLLLNSLEAQIHAHSSEWRMLPDFPDSEQQLTASMLSATDKYGSESDTLRRVDALSFRKATFAMKIRDFEGYCRSLTPKCWMEYRLSFLRVIDDYFTDVKSFFDLHAYFPRILSAAASCIDCNDTNSQNAIVSIVNHLLGSIDAIEEFSIAGCADRREKGAWKRSLLHYLIASISEGLTSAIPSVSLLDNIEALLRTVVKDYSAHCCTSSWQDLFLADLAYQPYRNLLLNDQFGINIEYATLRTNLQVADFDGVGVSPDYRKAVENLYAIFEPQQGVTLADCFPVRPFTTFDLFKRLRRNPSYKESCTIFTALSRLRGYNVPANKPAERSTSSFDVEVEWSRMPDAIRVALGNWKTDEVSCNAAICGVDDPHELSRFNRLMGFVNGVITTKGNPHYLVMPELSIPDRWFRLVASKLAVSNISFVAGIEYQRCAPGAKKVANQAWCSLITDILGFRDTQFVCFEKVHPALHERDELRKRADVELAPSCNSNRPAVVRHGSDVLNVCFSALICSDLLNIDYRQSLRGRIDLLFVPAWNQDVETFAPIVEATALDLHAFVVVCNDRAYGDSRIRVPCKEGYKRDVVRIKGGILDSHTIGELHITRLRKFQSYPVSPSGPAAEYKPIPIGYRVSDNRKMLPQ